MSQLSAIMQDSLRRETETRTILGLLREQVDGLDSIGGGNRRRRTLKERLGLKGIGCCGATWGFKLSTHDDFAVEEAADSGNPNIMEPDCVVPASSSGMNLAAALAAERQLRSTQEPEGYNNNNAGVGVGARGIVQGTPLRVSLMRLLEEKEGSELEGIETEKDGGRGWPLGNDSMCCVCMRTKKGAAFIPCGHTFCRVCSRELWLNRGSCPLCNRSINDILDIF